MIFANYDIVANDIAVDQMIRKLLGGNPDNEQPKFLQNCIVKLDNNRICCIINPSHTEMFGTHTLYERVEPTPPVISRTLTLRDLKFCRLLGVLFKLSENVKSTK